MLSELPEKLSLPMPKTKTLLPPAHSPPGTLAHLADQHNDHELPVYRFATAQIGQQNQVEVRYAIPQPSNPYGNRAGRTNSKKQVTVAETYVVRVPYTETIDGVSIPKVRTETRSRNIRVNRPVKRKKGKHISRSYTAFVPYTEEVEGKNYTRVRMETRTRMVPANNPAIKYSPSYISDTYEFTELKFMNTQGKLIAFAKAKKRLASPIPAIVLSNDSWICPWFEAALNANTILIMEKPKRAARKKK